MTFIYPAVFTPHKDDKGYHVNFRTYSAARPMDRIWKTRWSMRERQRITGSIWRWKRERMNFPIRLTRRT